MKTRRVSVYNISEGTQSNEQNVDTASKTHWWNTGQSPTHSPQQTQQASSSAVQDTVTLVHIAAIRIAKGVNAEQALQHNSRIKDLMVDSGAVTHVCPPETTLHKLQQGEGKDLRTGTDDIIVYGYKRINVIIAKIKQYSFRLKLVMCHNQSCQQHV